MIEINLLPPKDLLTQKEKEIRRYLIFLSVGIGLIVLSVTGTLFSIERVTSSNINSLNQKKEVLLADFQTNYSLALSHKNLNDKIKGIDKLRASRVSFSHRLQEIVELCGEEVAINKINLSTDNHIDLALVAKDLSAFGNLVDKFGSQQYQGVFTNAIVSQLQDVEGGYKFALGMDYVKKL